MQRQPEPELMDDPAHAAAYAAADFAEPHDAFVRYFNERFPTHAPQRALDLGCGPADVSIRFARAYPACRVLGVDGAAAMVQLAQAAARRAGVDQRFDVLGLRLPATIPGAPYDTIISNSLLHHLADPLVLWHSVRAAAGAGAAVCVMDLARPANLAQAELLVARHAADAPALLQQDFLYSLCAAYTVAEVQAQLRQVGVKWQVESVSDRHWLVHGVADGQGESPRQR